MYSYLFSSLFADIKDQTRSRSNSIVIFGREPSAMGVAECLVDRKTLLPSEAKHRLRDLASEWEDVADTKALKVVQMKGAMTNEIFQIMWPTDKENVSRKVILRIYGEGVEVFFDRDDEIRTFEFMSSYGQGPKLLGRFPNGRIEEFINAQVLWPNIFYFSTR